MEMGKPDLATIVNDPVSRLGCLNLAAINSLKWEERLYSVFNAELTFVETSVVS